MRLRSFLQAQAAWAVARIVNRSLFSISLIFKRLLYRQHTVRNSVELQGRYGVTPCLFVYFLGSTPKSVLAKKREKYFSIWSGRRQLQREQPETRDPAGACDEEARAGPAESVRL